MNTRFILSTSLLVFCSLLLRAQTPSGTVIINENTVAKIENDQHHTWRSTSFSEKGNPCRVFIGVGTTPESGGLRVTYTVDNTPATTYGLQVGDVILSLDNVPVSNQSELLRERDKHQQGDAFTLSILRNGSPMNIKARFKSCSSNVQRDPCAVFIGVYTTDAGMDEKGVRVTGVIDNTPAKESNVQPGDVILALDDQPIDSYDELSRERDKHQPGDAFRLKVLRGGSVINVKATFKACPKNTVAEPVQVTTPAAPTAGFGAATLEITALDIFPNPNYGLVNVQLEAEAVPTTVRITDAAGRVVYEKVLRQFAGTFSEQIDLQDQKPGVYTVSLQQGKKVVARNVVVLARV